MARFIALAVLVLASFSLLALAEHQVRIKLPALFTHMQRPDFNYPFQFEVASGSASLALYVNSEFRFILNDDLACTLYLPPNEYLIEAFIMDETDERTDINASAGVIIDADGTLRFGEYKYPVNTEDIDIVINPLVCVTFLSCRRLHVLNETVHGSMRYLQEKEPWISKETALVDNGSGPEGVQQILSYNIDSVTFFQKNRGIAQAWNTLIFSLCRSPYILTLEDDWVAKSNWDMAFPVISMAMDVLESDPKVIEVWLFDFAWFPEYEKNNRSEWISTPRLKILYRRQCAGEGSFWGTYSNRASLKRKSTLNEVGKQSYLNGEVDYARRVNQAGYCSAHLCLDSDTSVCLNNQGMYRVESHSKYVSLFSHGVGVYESSSGHRDFPKNMNFRDREL